VGRVTRSLRTAARWSNPLAVAVMNARFDAHHAGQIVVVDHADATATASRLATALDGRVGIATRADLLVGVAAAGAPNAVLAAVVGEHRRLGGEALIVVVGNAVERRAIERELRADKDVGISVMVFVDDLAGPELDRVRHRVADLVITSGRADQLINGGGFRRRYASSLPDIAERMEARVAKRLAIQAVLVDDPAKTAQTMKSSHATLVAATAGKSDDGFDAKHAGLVASVALLAPVWRRGAGRLEAFVPFTRIAVRGGLAYAVTRLVGMAARRLAMHGREPHQEER
jgi:hypothetical protein